MKEKIQLKRAKQKAFRILVYLSVFTFAFLGTDCQKIINSLTTGQDITGNWQLVRQTGSQQDICLGETANFQTNNVALLQCPGQTQISRTYSTSNGILSYTETSIQYDYTVQTNNGTTQLILTGKNVNRTLTYNKMIADKPVVISGDCKDCFNSSEFTKKKGADIK